MNIWKKKLSYFFSIHVETCQCRKMSVIFIRYWKWFGKWKWNRTSSHHQLYIKNSNLKQLQNKTKEQLPKNSPGKGWDVLSKNVKKCQKLAVTHNMSTVKKAFKQLD